MQLSRDQQAGCNAPYAVPAINVGVQYCRQSQCVPQKAVSGNLRDESNGANYGYRGSRALYAPI